MNRRSFLKRVIKSFFTLITFCISIFVIYLYPPKIKEKKTFHIFLSDEENLHKMGIKKYNYSFSISNKIINSFVFLKKTEDEIVVFSPYCTHLGCLIKWNSISNEFICSCHGGKFDKDGKVIAGPPPTPLERLPYQIKNGKIYIEIKTYE